MKFLTLVVVIIMISSVFLGKKKPKKVEPKKVKVNKKGRTGEVDAINMCFMYNEKTCVNNGCKWTTKCVPK